eukprot:239014-Chlamydomonas_euryale.AAC.1
MTECVYACLDRPGNAGLLKGLRGCNAQLQRSCLFASGARVRMCALNDRPSQGERERERSRASSIALVRVTS